MFRPLTMIFAASVATLGATAAHAGTHWSVGISLPIPGVVITNGGYYASEPHAVYYAAAPEVRYAPAPVYEAPPVYVAPPVVYSTEQPAYDIRYRSDAYRQWEGDRDARWERHERWEHARHEREEDRWDHGDRGHDEGNEHSWHRD